MYPTLWRSGDLVLYTHDFFTVVGMLAGLALYYRALRRDRMLGPQIILVSVSAIVGAGIGARLITAWERVDYFAAALDADVPLTLMVTHSGKSIIGGIAGAYLAIVLTKRALAYRESTGDYYAAAIPLAMAIGRIGCFLSELPLGTPSSLPWAMSVSPEAAAQFTRCPACDGPMHPSMLYEIAFHAAAFAVIARRGPLLPVRGDTLKLYLLAAAIFRFGVEFVRGNEVQLAGLTGPQVVLIPLAALLAYHFLRQVRRGAYRMPVPEPA